MNHPHHPSPVGSHPRTTRIAVGYAWGASGALVGLAPWLVGGAQLPLQNLWAQADGPDEMPLVLLPLSQYRVSAVASVLIVGAAVSGLLARALAPRGCSVFPVAAGLVTTHAVATVQSFSVLYLGLGLGAGGGHPRAPLYFTGMLVGTIVVVITAQAAFWLISRPTVGPVALGLVLVAPPAGSWVSTWFAGTNSTPIAVAHAMPWVPPLVAAATLVWCGVRPPARLAIWATAGAVLCFVPPFVTAVTTALGTRSLGGDSRETVAVMQQLFPAAIPYAVVQAVVAITVAAGVQLILAVSRR